MARKENIKFLLLGSAGVGKTCLIQQYVKKKFVDPETTVGVDIEVSKIVMDNKDNIIEIWDTAGQERFYALCKPHYRGTDCCILVFDVTDRNSFMNMFFWHTEFLEHSKVEDPQNFPFVVLANKVDLDSDRLVSKEEALRWCNLKNIPYYETSAKDGRNLKEVFKELTRKVLQNNTQKPTEANMADEPIDLTQKDSLEQTNVTDNNCCNHNNVSFKVIGK